MPERCVRARVIAEAVTQYHIDRDVSGIVLCDVCHAREHTADA